MNVIRIVALGIVMILWLSVDSMAAGTAIVQDQAATAEYSDASTTSGAQRKLKGLGYYTGAIDGVVGEKTHRAILEFQKDLNIPVTGKLDRETVTHISRPTLIFTTEDFAPFAYEIATLKNKVFGAVSLAVRVACVEAGLNCVVRLYDWGYAQDLVRQGRAHGMFPIGWNVGRAKYLNRSVPLIQTEYGVFVRDNEPLDFEQISDLDGYTVGVYGPSNTATNLRRIENTLKSKGMRLHIKQARDDKPLFKALSLSKGVRAVYSNKDAGIAIIAGLGLDNIRYAGRHKKLLYHVGFSKTLVDKSIVDRFNKAFLELKQRGIIQEIYANNGLGGNVKIESIEIVKEQEIAEPKPVQRLQLEVSEDSLGSTRPVSR